MFYKVGSLKNFAISRENTFVESIFKEVIEKRPQHRFFFSEYCKSFKNSLFYETRTVAVKPFKEPTYFFCSRWEW